MNTTAPLWPADEWDVDAMGAAFGHVVQRVCDSLTHRQQAGLPSPSLEVGFCDPRTVVVIGQRTPGFAYVWAYRVGAPCCSQMDQPALIAL